MTDKVHKKKTVSGNFSHALFSLSTHNDMVMQGLVWLHTVQLRVIWFGVVWFSAS